MPTRREFIESAAAGAAIASLVATPALAQAEGEAVQQAIPSRLKIVALEEHVVLPPLQEAWSRVPGLNLNLSLGFGDSPTAQLLRDVGERRLAAMDDQGVDMQVMAASSPGVQVLSATEAVPVARDFNDALAEVVRSRPNRFQAFAAIPTPAPEACATELERAVTELGLVGAMIYGRTGDMRPEDRAFDDLYATAARLGVPLYFHPQLIVPEVREAMYTGVNPDADRVLASTGIGWYYDLGIQVVRMMATGVFDRHPDLQIIMGHWGEVVLFYLDHLGYIDGSLEVERPLIDYFRHNVWITGSGTQSERYQRWTAEVVGTERMLYSTDYPFTIQSGDPYIETSRGRGRSFLADAPTFTVDEKAAIASGNWQRLIGPVTSAFE